MRILLTTTSYQDCPGDHHALLESTGAEIVRERGPLSEAQMLNLAGDFDAFLHLIDKDDLKTGGVFFSMSDENLSRVLAEPYVSIGSDGSMRAPWGPLSQDHPHPRSYGSHTRFLRAALDGGHEALALAGPRDGPALGGEGGGVFEAVAVGEVGLTRAHGAAGAVGLHLVPAEVRQAGRVHEPTRAGGGDAERAALANGYEAVRPLEEGEL